MQSVEANSLPRDVRAALASGSRVMITQNIYTNTRYVYLSFFVNPLYWTDALDHNSATVAFNTYRPLLRRWRYAGGASHARWPEAST